MSAEFYIGRYDLDFIDDFYPDDLPNEWRFSFYANMFNALLLPLETEEDIEGILEDQTPEFQLVFEVKPEEFDNGKLDEVLGWVSGRDNVTFFAEVDEDPSKETLAKLKNNPTVFKCEKPLKLTGYQNLSLKDCQLYFNKHPVVVSSLSLSDQENRHFLEEIAKTKRKTIIICRSAESSNLEKARLLSDMLGF